MDMAPPLTFAAVDDMAFAPSTAPRAPVQFHPIRLGPLAEFAILKAQGRLGACADGRVAEAGPLWSMLTSQQTNTVLESPSHASCLRLGGQPVPETELTRLSILTKRAARAAGFDERAAAQLSAAVGELLSNIIDHSEASHTGLVAFQARDGCFEFVAADQGVGALASLQRNPRFATLTSQREALPLVLQHGCSRHAELGRGAGFDDMFRGLANHNGNLRFRSGDAAVLIDGASPLAIRPTVKKKPYLQGFIASVACMP
jgi:hypothetical protein